MINHGQIDYAVFITFKWCALKVINASTGCIGVEE
jgi:hypothetical protein